jgi:hypothetical protein
VIFVGTDEMPAAAAEEIENTPPAVISQRSGNK